MKLNIDTSDSAALQRINDIFLEKLMISQHFLHGTAKHICRDTMDTVDRLKKPRRDYKHPNACTLKEFKQAFDLGYTSNQLSNDPYLGDRSMMFTLGYEAQISEVYGDANVV